MQINGAFEKSSYIAITYLFLFFEKYYLHTIVQSVVWIDGLFLSNLIFTTQVCCGQLNEVGQLNAVLRYLSVLWQFVKLVCLHVHTIKFYLFIYLSGDAKLQ